MNSKQLSAHPHGGGSEGTKLYGRERVSARIGWRSSSPKMTALCALVSAAALVLLFASIVFDDLTILGARHHEQRSQSHDFVDRHDDRRTFSSVIAAPGICTRAMSRYNHFQDVCLQFATWFARNTSRICHKFPTHKGSPFWPITNHGHFSLDVLLMRRCEADHLMNDVS